MGAHSQARAIFLAYLLQGHQGISPGTFHSQTGSGDVGQVFAASDGEGMADKRVLPFL